MKTKHIRCDIYLNLLELLSFNTYRVLCSLKTRLLRFWVWCLKSLPKLISYLKIIKNIFCDNVKNVALIFSPFSNIQQFKYLLSLITAKMIKNHNKLSKTGFDQFFGSNELKRIHSQSEKLIQTVLAPYICSRVYFRFNPCMFLCCTLKT